VRHPHIHFGRNMNPRRLRLAPRNRQGFRQTLGNLVEYSFGHLHINHHGQ